ncbi:MAG: hypothetical protein Q8O26_19505 [Phreatobacter sp.]|uniref:hypothetical protein n=1 Tax=Phreatobacter sp. TaxID=1966341 RepID=UPI0027339999|nr:hypothetical protein [Phreatobacter sp.]MDP2804063.1 hypothetical protein [Phreatobacter sp.]
MISDKRIDTTKPLIHVGFAHTGTTSLQENIFQRLPNVFYAGIPYSTLGGIFSYIKYLDFDDYRFDLTHKLCFDYIFDKMVPGQRLVLSDETFVDQPATYFTPAMMPVRMVAERLKYHFGNATILFTIRSQYASVLSNYQVYRSRSRSLSGLEVESFNAWLAGNTTQMRNLYLRNLDISHAIQIYADVFGVESVKVLPLKILMVHGFDVYRDRLSEATGLELSSFSADAYVARNKSDDASLNLNDHQRQVIWERAKEGNKRIARAFGLPLAEFGYPFP